MDNIPNIHLELIDFNVDTNSLQIFLWINPALYRHPELPTKTHIYERTAFFK